LIVNVTAIGTEFLNEITMVVISVDLKMVSRDPLVRSDDLTCRLATHTNLSLAHGIHLSLLV
jgi:hypothetical protein